MIDEFVFEDRSIAAIFILVVEEHVGVSAELEFSGAGVFAFGCDDVDQVVIFGGHAAAVIEHLVGEHFALAEAGTF